MEDGESKLGVPNTAYGFCLLGVQLQPINSCGLSKLIRCPHTV